jgi:CDP-diacylglycerol--glycerol-3-phosphate 3-phosphatidyltransferase
MYMTSLRLLALTEEVEVPVSQLGKWKTTAQMIAMPMLMIYEEFLSLDMAFFGTLLIYISALLSLWSAVLYSVTMVKKLQLNRLQKKKIKKSNLPSGHIS